MKLQRPTVDEIRTITKSFNPKASTIECAIKQRAERGYYNLITIGLYPREVLSLQLRGFKVTKLTVPTTYLIDWSIPIPKKNNKRSKSNANS
jgi:hypothetical protein